LSFFIVPINKMVEHSSVVSAICGILCTLRAVEEWWLEQRRSPKLKLTEDGHKNVDSGIINVHAKLLEKYNQLASIIGRDLVANFDGG
jgi:hypothetical protein